PGPGGGQACANPKVTNSNHSKGCAVDLGWEQNSCNSAACQWVIQNSAQYQLNIPMHYGPEWNHVQPVQLGQCQLQAGNTDIPPSVLFNTTNPSPCITSINPLVVAPPGTAAM